MKKPTALECGLWGCLAVAILALGLALSSCAPLATSAPRGIVVSNYTQLWYGSTSVAVRWIDREAGVVCYQVANGLACVPLSQTRLEEPNGK